MTQSEAFCFSKRCPQANEKKNLDYFSIYSNRDTIIYINRHGCCASTQETVFWCEAVDWTSDQRSVLYSGPEKHLEILKKQAKNILKKMSVFCFSNFALKKSYGQSLKATLNLFCIRERFINAIKMCFLFIGDKPQLNKSICVDICQLHLFTCVKWENWLRFIKQTIKLYCDKLLRLAINLSDLYVLLCFRISNTAK